MRKNNDTVIKLFVNKASEGLDLTNNQQSLKATNDGKKLMHYETCIAQFVDNIGLVVNKTKYSPATSKLRNMVISSYGYIITYVDNVPMGENDLVDYLKEVVK